MQSYVRYRLEVSLESKQQQQKRLHLIRNEFQMNWACVWINFATDWKTQNSNRTHCSTLYFSFNQRSSIDYIRTYFRIHCTINIIIISFSFTFYWCLMDQSNAKTYRCIVDYNRNWMFHFSFFAVLLLHSVSLVLISMNLKRFVEYSTADSFVLFSHFK